MRRRTGTAVASSIIAALIVGAAFAVPARAMGQPTLADAASGAAQIDIARPFGNTPLVFERNQGQAHASVRFIARAARYELLIGAGTAVLNLRGALAAGPSDARRQALYMLPLRMRFVGADGAGEVLGEGRLPGSSNYFIGSDASKFITDAPHFDRVIQRALYPGIDVVYYGRQRQLEYDLIVAPGEDPSRIMLEIEGADAIDVSESGDLVLHTALGDLVQHKPDVHQTIAGERVPVAARYMRLDDNRFGFEFAAYARSEPLVIDPVLSYSTLLGGSGDDRATGLVVDAAGNAYITGGTLSTNFPLVGAIDTSLGRKGSISQDIFITKLNPTGTGVIYSTFLGGTAFDQATGIAIDTAGSVYVTGTTTGSDFPTTAGAYQTGSTSGGAFVTKLNPAGSALVYSTYLRGAKTAGIAVDAGNFAYVTGSANSAFATTAGAFQTTLPGGAGSTFVAKINTNGSALAYATYLGDTGQGNAIAVDAAGNAYVVGETASPNLPTLNPLQPAPGGSVDAFVSELNPTGGALVFSTYLGGSLSDSAKGVAVDAAGYVYIAGETNSANFPVFQAQQPIKAYTGVSSEILNQAFVTKLAPLGDAFIYSTYLGGKACLPPQGGSCSPSPPIDGAAAIAVDANGGAYVTGYTSSITFPVVNPIQANLVGPYNVFVSRYNQFGQLVFSTFLGSNGFLGITNEPGTLGASISLDPNGASYVAGFTNGGNFVTTPGALRTVNDSGGYDGLVFKLAWQPANVVITTGATEVITGRPVSLTATVTDPSSGAPLTGGVQFWSGRTLMVGQATLVNGTATVSTSALAPGIHRLYVEYKVGSNFSESKPVIVVVNPSLECN